MTAEKEAARPWMSCPQASIEAEFAAGVAKPGSLAANGRSLSLHVDAFLSSDIDSLEGERIKLRSGPGNKLHAECDDAGSRRSGPAAGQFSMLSGEALDEMRIAWLGVLSERLKDAIERTIGSVAPEAERYNLSGVNLRNYLGRHRQPCLAPTASPSRWPGSSLCSTCFIFRRGWI